MPNLLTDPAIDQETLQYLLDIAAAKQQTLAMAQSVLYRMPDRIIDGLHEHLDSMLTELSNALGIKIPDTYDIPNLQDMTVAEFIETIRQIDIPR